MLMTKDYKKDDVVTFQLSTGQEVIAKIVEERMDAYVVSKPFAIVLQQNGPAIGPMLFSADPNNDVTLYKTGVNITTPTVSEFKKAYLQSISGLDLSAAPSIVT